MGRWIVILSLVIGQYPEIVRAAPHSANMEAPKHRHTHRRHHHPVPALNTVAARRPVKPVAKSAAREFGFDDSPVQSYPVRPYRGSDCSGGTRIISAFYWEGRHTASGQPFNPHGLTAAHRTLPFGTRLTVSNPRTGKSVDVVVNDRGPFVSGVNLDLSLGAAQAIGMRGTGAVCISH
jgi:rare lipoprotein A (peptidoglycan hydrolase)